MSPVLAFLFGAIGWTLSEYAIHRWFGHHKKLLKNPFGVEHVMSVQCRWALLPAAQSVSRKAFSVCAHGDKSVGAFRPQYHRQYAVEQHGSQQSASACHGLLARLPGADASGLMFGGGNQFHRNGASVGCGLLRPDRSGNYSSAISTAPSAD